MMREHDHEDVVLEEDDGIYEKGQYSQEFSSSGPSTDIPEGTFGRHSVGLIEEVCRAVSFQRYYLSDGTASGRLLSAWSLFGATPGHGVLHIARSLCTDRSLL